MNRPAAIAIAIAIVAAAVGLLMWSRTSPETPASTPEAARPADGPESAEPVDRRRSRQPEADRREPDRSAADVREVERKSGGIVRDHRRNTDAVIDPSSTPRVPLKNAPVDPRLIIQMRAALRPIVAACAREHASDLSDGAELRQRVAVAVSGEVLRVTELDAKVTGIAGTGLADCVAEKAKQIELRAEGHEDVRHHMLTFPFRLPAK